MAEKGFFGVTKSYINRTRKEVNKDYGLSTVTPKAKKKKRKKSRCKR